jgi:hypothetical protein
MAGKFINIEDLHIDLIDRINPFQRAFEILSKSVTAQILRVIQGAIEASRIQMSDEEAVIYYKKYYEFKIRNSRDPDLNSQDCNEKRMAEAIIYLKEKKRKRDAGEI